MKWADYLISAVRYNSSGTHIDNVKVHEDKDDSVSAGKEWTRKEVVDALSKGKTFCTIYKSKDNEWSKGEQVTTVAVTTTFIKTKADKKDVDNLENLPTF